MLNTTTEEDRPATEQEVLEGCKKLAEILGVSLREAAEMLGHFAKNQEMLGHFAK